MKGTVTYWKGHFSSGFITGDDGKQYFIHTDDVINSNNLKKTCRVEFDAKDEGKDRPRAINARKISHGISHPFYQDLKRLYEYVENTNGDAVEKGYKLRDIQTMMDYFAEVEDIEQFPDVKSKFRYC